MASTRVANLSIQQLRDRWREHIEWIAEEANYMAGHRTRYRLVEKWLFRRRFPRWVNRHLQAFGWISKLWLTEGLMSVRRQLDSQHGSISLKALLHEIEASSEALPGIGASEVDGDRRDLEKACADALAFAQRQLAHRTPWDDPFVSMIALDNALDAIQRVVHKYYRLIVGRKPEPPEREPDPAWLRSFEVAWNKPRKSRRPARRRRPAAQRRRTREK